MVRLVNAAQLIFVSGFRRETDTVPNLLAAHFDADSLIIYFYPGILFASAFLPFRIIREFGFWL